MNKMQPFNADWSVSLVTLPSGHLSSPASMANMQKGVIIFRKFFFPLHCAMFCHIFPHFNMIIWQKPLLRSFLGLFFLWLYSKGASNFHLIMTPPFMNPSSHPHLSVNQQERSSSQRGARLRLSLKNVPWP